MDAPGKPGIPPTWASSAKDMVGCALGPSRLWFTLGFGIVNEVYYPARRYSRRSATSASSSPTATVSGSRSSARRHTPCACAAPGVPAVEIVHRARALQARPAHHARPRARRAADRVSRSTGDATLRPYACSHRISAAPATTMSPTVFTARGRTVLWAEQGPFGLALAAADESSATPAAAPAPAMSGQATAGRTSRATAR